ncbi:AMP-binding enzyme [Natronospirillum operosum]|uniref:AMP-binding enzyme n=1 Tax=Natronospirillum operosum TaxID=2759953 RepID=UPI00197C1710|nr:hypothetical protein [Natronospirillum operosum]
MWSDIGPNNTAQPLSVLAEDIQQFVRQHLAAYEAPREVEFVEELPLTTTGKVMRRVLREQERRSQ